MNKPKDYDSISGYDDERLELGGHYLQIIKVEETKAKSGRPMLIIYLDTSEFDKQPKFFKNRFDNDTRQNKKWGCRYYQLTTDSQNPEATNHGLKRFHECVEKSNPGFNVKWGSDYEKCFKGKHIGGVFGREQFVGQNGKEHFAVKCFYLTTTDAIERGVDIPDDRLLDTSEKPAFAGGAVVPEPTDDDYPF